VGTVGLVYSAVQTRTLTRPYSLSIEDLISISLDAISYKSYKRNDVVKMIRLMNEVSILQLLSKIIQCLINAIKYIIWNQVTYYSLTFQRFINCSGNVASIIR
jgi:hypothetical protein